MDKKRAEFNRQGGPSRPIMVPMFPSGPYPVELLHADRVLVKQKGNGFCGGNKYLIKRADGVDILTAKEEGSVVFGNERRSFRMRVVNNQGVEVLTFHRPWKWTTSKLEVHMGGQLVSLVRQKSTWFDTVININDARDTPVIRVKGCGLDTTFEIQTLDKRVIGGISKVIEGLMKEIFTNLDTFVVTFPADLDVRYKSAVIGTCILLDYLKYEKH